MLTTIGNFLLLCLTFQGLVLCVLLFYSSKKIKSNRWLATFIFLISYSTIQTAVFGSAIPNNFPWVYFVLPQLRLALGPALYFYTRSLLAERQRLTLRDKLQFVPLIIEWGPQVAFIFRFSGLLSFVAIKNWYLPFEQRVISFESGVSGSLPFFFSFLIYSLFCYKLVSESSNDQQPSPIKRKDVIWLKRLLIVVFPIIVFWLFTLILSYFPLSALVYPIRYALSLLAIGFAYWLGMSAYARQYKMSATDLVEYHNIRAKVYFSSMEAEQYSERLIALMEKEQLYLNPSLKLDMLAEKMALPEKQLSNLLNQHIGKSFNDFINEYRVHEAKQKLTDVTLSKFTIASIAFDCGFNSLATFQRCFKQFTGITPSTFQNGLNRSPLPLK